MIGAFYELSAVRDLIRDAAAEAGGLRPLARLWGVSYGYVQNLVRKENRAPSQRILDKLGLKKITLYARET